MKFEDLKSIVGTTGRVTITSDDLRYSELHALVEKVATIKEGLLTVIVKNGTLKDAEIKGLAQIGGQFLTLDFSQP